MISANIAILSAGDDPPAFDAEGDHCGSYLRGDHDGGAFRWATACEVFFTPRLQQGNLRGNNEYVFSPSAMRPRRCCAYRWSSRPPVSGLRWRFDSLLFQAANGWGGSLTEVWISVRLSCLLRIIGFDRFETVVRRRHRVIHLSLKVRFGSEADAIPDLKE